MALFRNFIQRRRESRAKQQQQHRRQDSSCGRISPPADDDQCCSLASVYCSKPPAFPVDSMRMVLFSEGDRKERKIIFDSATVIPVAGHHHHSCQPSTLKQATTSAPASAVTPPGARSSKVVSSPCGKFEQHVIDVSGGGGVWDSSGLAPRLSWTPGPLGFLWSDKAISPRAEWEKMRPTAVCMYGWLASRQSIGLCEATERAVRSVGVWSRRRRRRAVLVTCGAASVRAKRQKTGWTTKRICVSPPTDDCRALTRNCPPLRAQSAATCS
uniref:Uncharacterized protein n=1 Tax=Plectus sambesii TaxID=2011161 RepID=A0A914VNU7_9BILA